MSKFLYRLGKVINTSKSSDRRRTFLSLLHMAHPYPQNTREANTLQHRACSLIPLAWNKRTFGRKRTRGGNRMSTDLVT